MGSENGADDEKPVHRVSVDPFWIAIQPITNSEYRLFLRANPQETAPELMQDPRFSDDLQPVVGVDWFDANAYANWLSQITGNAIAFQQKLNGSLRPQDRKKTFIHKQN
jgi:formylglycine-generating enzyme required for sulfatase activity